MMLRVDDGARRTNSYVRDMHLNTVRLEGKMMNDHFFSTADRKGILVMAGWCCCDYWERWQNWKPEDYTIAGESLRDQLRRLRNHPSVLTFLYGSDKSPNAEVEAVYLKVLKEENWPNPTVSSAAARKTSGAGPTGVKMTGPYDYVAPTYWLLDIQVRRRATASTPRPAPAPRSPTREPRRDAAQGASLADRRVLEFPRGRRRLSQVPNVFNDRARSDATASARASRTTCARAR